MIDYKRARSFFRVKKSRKIFLRKYKKKLRGKRLHRVVYDISEFKKQCKEFSPTLDFLKKKRFLQENLSDEWERLEITMPKTFSLIENPDEVFSVLKCITAAAFNKKIKEINFDYSKSENLEIGALTLKNIICLNLMKKNIILGGNFPGVKDRNEDGSIKEKYKKAIEILVHSGLFNALRLNPEEFFDKVNVPIKLPLHGTGKDTVLIPCKKLNRGEIEKNVTQYFNKCLRKSINGELSENGLRIFDKIIGEVISNCHEHSGSEFNQYFCSGHFTQLDEDYGNYQLFIVNFGQTIYEGLKDFNTLPKNVKVRIEKLVDLHKKKWYKIFDKTIWDEEALYTLFSLQNKVSRVFDETKTRGTGTIKMLQAFQEVGGCNKAECIPKMTIISGKTQILIDDSEICKLKNRTITFNTSNTLEDRPNENYVKKIENYFPGTIIDLNIYLDKKWLEERILEEKTNKEKKI